MIGSGKVAAGSDGVGIDEGAAKAGTIARGSGTSRRGLALHPVGLAGGEALVDGGVAIVFLLGGGNLGGAIGGVEGWGLRFGFQGFRVVGRELGFVGVLLFFDISFALFCIFIEECGDFLNDGRG